MLVSSVLFNISFLRRDSQLSAELGFVQIPITHPVSQQQNQIESVSSDGCLITPSYAMGIYCFVKTKTRDSTAIDDLFCH